MVKHAKLTIAPPPGVRRAQHRKKRGGFLPAAALPFIAAAALPVLGKAGSYIGHKIFGNGIIRAGATRNMGGKKRAARR